MKQKSTVIRSAHCCSTGTHCIMQSRYHQHPSKQQELPDFLLTVPEHCMLYILSLLSACDQAWAARRVSRVGPAKFRDVVRISAKDPELSAGALQEFYLQHAASEREMHKLIAR